MAQATATVRFTANFEANLARIATFWEERGAAGAYHELLEDLGSTVIDNLERHPRMGRRFFSRSGQSVEVRARVAALSSGRGAVEVREYLVGDYLILYGVVEEGAPTRKKLAIYLLAIRHHRELSFDFESFWQANRGAEG